MICSFQGDGVSMDLAQHKLNIYHLKPNTSAPEELGIVIEDVPVVTNVENLTKACILLIGLTYAINLAYPKEVRYTLECFQKLFLELDCSKPSPKLNTLRNKLLL